jgi:hypothetical protein
MNTEDAPKIPKRGEAAWKAMKEGVAERNEQAHKAAVAERKAHQLNADRLKQAASAKRAARIRPGPDAR